MKFNRGADEDGLLDIALATATATATGKIGKQQIAEFLRIQA